MSLPIPPHGGLSEPICRTVPADEATAFSQEAASLTKVPVSDADLSTVYRFGDGALSPLTGPMNSAVYNQVLEEGRIEHNGASYAWSIPLSLPVTEELAGGLLAGQKVALANSANEVVATLEINDVFPLGQTEISHQRLSDRPHRPPRRRHGPQERRRQDAPDRRRHQRACKQDSPRTRSSATPSRALAAEKCAQDARRGKGFEAGPSPFQTRNPLHRAHEYALPLRPRGQLLGEGKNAVACTQPLCSVKPRATTSPRSSACRPTRTLIASA